MPPKKPIKIKLKTNVIPADTRGYTAECWELLVRAIGEVLQVPTQCAPPAVGGAIPNEPAAAAASSTAAGNARPVDGIRSRQIAIYRRVSATVSFHTVYTAATDLARTDAPDMLKRVSDMLQEHIPRALDAWLGAAERALSAAAQQQGGGDDAAVAAPFDAQTCMRHVVACWEFIGAAVRVVADYVAYLDNTYARLHAVVDGGICGVGTSLVGKLLSTTYSAVFATVCRGYVDAVADDRAGNATRWSDLSSCRQLLLATNAYHGSSVEQPLIEAADKFFTKTGNVLVYAERLTAAAWVRRVEHELRTEDRRLVAYGHTSASRAIMQTAYERLAKAHIAYVATESLRILIQERDFATLTAVHRLSRHRFVKQEDSLKKAFREYVVKAASEILNADATVEDSIIDMLVALNQTANATVNKCFAIGTSGTDAFTGAKKDAFEAAMRATKVGGPNRASELLARYLDAILRDGASALRGRGDGAGDHNDDDGAGLTSAELTDKALTDAMQLFSYIPNKDIFEALYKRHFGKRLILQRSCGVEHERVVIEQLRMVCGPSTALKLNGMLKDMELSKELVTLYKNTRFVRATTNANGKDEENAAADAASGGAAGGMGRQQSTVGMMGEPSLSDIGPAQSAYAQADFDPTSSLPRQDSAVVAADTAAAAAVAPNVDLRPCGFDFNALVLSEGYWPTFNMVNPAVPPAVERQMELFRVFYLSKHGSRKLQWHHALAHCVIKARFPKSRAKELVVSFLQTVILTHFNDVDAMSYKELCDRMHVEQSEEMTCAVIGLYAGNARVLLREKKEGLPELPKPKKGDARVVVRDEDTIRFNAGFTHRLVKIRVNQVQLRETKEEVEETTEKVMAERHFIVDAAIVRFMKSRKEAKHNDLIGEVLKMLRFEAQPAGVKKRIEHLIEREYLERDDADPSLYRYLA